MREQCGRTIAKREFVRRMKEYRWSISPAYTYTNKAFDELIFYRTYWYHSWYCSPRRRSVFPTGQIVESKDSRRGKVNYNKILFLLRVLILSLQITEEIDFHQDFSKRRIDDRFALTNIVLSGPTLEHAYYHEPVLPRPGINRNE